MRRLAGSRYTRRVSPQVGLGSAAGAPGSVAAGGAAGKAVGGGSGIGWGRLACAGADAPLCLLLTYVHFLRPPLGLVHRSLVRYGLAGGQPVWSARRAFVLAGAAAAALPAAAQVDVGKSSALRKLVPAEELEGAARQQYTQMMGEAGGQARPCCPPATRRCSACTPLRGASSRTHRPGTRAPPNGSGK
jgi:hypothetical protein